MSAAFGNAPALSVIVPSYNRRDSLEMVLRGLAAQRGLPPGAMEVIVVLDGSTDGSDAMLTTWERDARLPGLRWETRGNAGQAAARDAGSRAAAAPVLLFLDDDVVPEPDLVVRHLAHHAAGERIAVLGDCEIVRGTEHPLYMQLVWAWWDETYASRVRPGRVPCYTDFCAGNVSLRRDDYLASGGFDPAFRGYGGEDYDLGYRLLGVGVRFVADRAARAMHHHRLGGYAKLLRSRQQEGQADVLLGRKHLELRAGLRAVSASAGVARAAFSPRAQAARGLRARIARLEFYERTGQRRRWGHELGALGREAYWRGVRDMLGSWEGLDAFRREATVPVQHVDVGRGVPTPGAGFWVHGPTELQVSANGEPLGTVRLPGPVTRPLREAIADAIQDGLTVPLLLHAERTGASLFQAIPAPAR